ncbi:MAG: PD-(D/E)XK nuclease family protein [Acidimicrobiales bacterium]|nr:PD-(D/E)XK nuclease family protein [Acidimicrobiales bacterium]
MTDPPQEPPRDPSPDAATEPRDDALNPAQRETLDRLTAPRDTWPEYDQGLRRRLREHLEGDLSEVAVALSTDRPMRVSKHALAGVHGCEARWLADDDDPSFEASPATVRGSVAHKAIELGINRREPAAPAELVDIALDRLTESDAWMADWLRTCDEDDRAEVRAAAIAKVQSFEDVWPPLKPAWRPVTELPVRADLLGGRIVLAGRVDLGLGRPDGGRAGRVVVDFKTGGFAVHHRDDGRFYALVEALRIGVPPRAVATSYLDSGAIHVDPVDEDVLHAAAARVVDGVTRIVALRERQLEPERRPSAVCRWCRLLDTCDVGRAHLADA